MIDITRSGRVRELLVALSEQLAARGQHYELVVVGGSALLALALVERATKDVDVVALRHAGSLSKADPLPPSSMPAIESRATLVFRRTGSILVRPA
jgi:hypothetical protein